MYMCVCTSGGWGRRAVTRSIGLLKGRCYATQAQRDVKPAATVCTSVLIFSGFMQAIKRRLGTYVRTNVLQAVTLRSSDAGDVTLLGYVVLHRALNYRTYTIHNNVCIICSLTHSYQYTPACVSMAILHVSQ